MTVPRNGNLKSIENAFDESEASARRLMEGVSHTQANWQPCDGRSWSIYQCLEHLARGNTIYAASVRAAIASCPQRYREPTTDIAPGLLASWFIRSLEPPPRRKSRAPSKIVPTGRGSASEILDAFVKSHQAMRAILADGRSIDLNRLRFKNPFIGILHFTVGAGLMAINAHDRRHLWQAGQVKASPGYPTS